MSKRLGNAIDPFGNIEKFGSDPVRWYMISNSSPWDNLKYDEKGVEEVSRKLFSTIYNTYKFFALYANVDGFTGAEKEVPLSERPEIDRWILSLLNSLIKEVTSDLEDYEPTKAARAIEDFVNDNLSNWYVRLNRKRFWAGVMDQDKLSAYQTLYTCLKTVALLIAPFAPFYADRLYRDLIEPTKEGDGYASVHTADFPVSDEESIDSSLENKMSLAQKITSNVLALRRKINIKVRQPLQTLLVSVINETQKEGVKALENLIKSEVNVKQLNIVDNEESSLVKKVKADFKKLGPKYGKIMKQLGAAISNMTQAQISELEKTGQFTFSGIEGSPVITLNDVDIYAEDIPGWLVANDGDLTVALDVTVTPELRNEGMARELVNRIQNLRKSSGFEITDKIKVKLSDLPELRGAVESFGDYIAGQVLAKELSLVDLTEDDNVTDLEIEGLDAKVKISKSE